MEQFALRLETVPGAVDSDLLDRLADIVYEIPELQDVVMALSADGSLSASFVVAGDDPVQAGQPRGARRESARAAED